MAIALLDERIGELLQELSKDKELLVKDSKPKPVRHHAPKINGLHQMLIRLPGADASSVSDINDYTLLRLT